MANTETIPAHRKTKGIVDGWLDQMLRQFFAQKRAAWSKASRDGYEFGWAAKTVMGKLQEEGPAAGASLRISNYPEHYTPDAWLVRRAIEGCPYDAYVAGHVHYIVSAPVKVKAIEAGFSVAGYWNHLAVFHSWVQGRLLVLEPSLTQ